MGARLPEDKGVRLLRMSKGLSRMTVQFAWNSPGATIFRIKLKQWAASRGIHTYEQLGGTLGPKWAHRNRERIASYPVDWNVLNPVRKYATQDGIVEVNLKDVECLERVHVAAVLVEEHECTFKTAMEYLAMPDNSSAKRAAFSEILNARNPF